MQSNRKTRKPSPTQGRNTRQVTQNRPPTKNAKKAVRNVQHVQQSNQLVSRKKKIRNKNNLTKQQMHPYSNIQMPLPCTLDYAYCLLDPFGCNVPVCVPDLHVLDSLKHRSFLRGSFNAGTTGFGFVAYNPHQSTNDPYTCRPAYCQNLASAGANAPCHPVVYSTAAYTGTEMINDFQDDGTPNYTIGGKSITNFPYEQTDFAQNLESSYSDAWLTGNKRVRLVAAGIRARYTGTELNLGGNMVLFREPDNASLLPSQGDEYSMDEVLAHPNALVIPISRKWKNVVWKPVSEDDYTFCPNGLNGIANSTFQKMLTGSETVLSSNSSPAWPLAIIVFGCVAGVSFEYEVFGHYEFIGAIANKTKSHSDINGVSLVRNIVPDGPSDRPAASIATSLVKQLTDPTFLETVYDVGTKYVVPAIGMLL